MGEIGLCGWYAGSHRQPATSPDVIIGLQQSPRLRPAAILKKENCNNSATIWAIVTKFGMVVDMDSPQRAVTSFLTCNKIQDGDRPPFWKMENRRNAAVIWVIVAKFGVLVTMDHGQPTMSHYVIFVLQHNPRLRPAAILKNGKLQ